MNAYTAQPRYTCRPASRTRGEWEGSLCGYDFNLRVTTLGNPGGHCASYTLVVSGCVTMRGRGLAGLRRARQLGMARLRQHVALQLGHEVPA